MDNKKNIFCGVPRRNEMLTMGQLRVPDYNKLEHCDMIATFYIRFRFIIVIGLQAIQRDHT